MSIGIDALPSSIRLSDILTGTDLQLLGDVTELPLVDASFEDEMLKNIFQYYSINPDEMEKELHRYAKKLLAAGEVDNAWQVLLALN